MAQQRVTAQEEVMTEQGWSFGMVKEQVMATPPHQLVLVPASPVHAEQVTRGIE